MSQQLSEELRQRFKRRIEEVGFNQLVGIKMVDIQVGSCVTELEIGPQYLNPNGWLHGGVITTICDVTAGFAAATTGYRMTTVNSTTEFMRRGPASGKVTCKTYVEKQGRTLTWAKAALYDENDRKLSESTIVYFNLDKIDLSKYQ